MKNYSKMLQKYRFDNNLTQEQMANQLNVSRQLVSKWETGSSIPNADDLVQLAHLFQCTVDELLLEETTEQKESKIKKFVSLCKKHKTLTCIIGIASIALILLSIILPIVLTKYADYDYITYVEDETTYIQINKIDANNEKTIVIPKKIHGKIVGKIRENAIIGANELVKIELPFVGTELEPSEEENGSFKKIFFNSEIPSTLTKITVTSNQIPNKAFSGVKVAEFDIQNAEIIGKEAFAYTSFSSILFSSKIKEIKDYAFKSSSLQTLDLFENVKYGIGVFSYCENIESIQIPDSWTTLPKEFFSSCKGLKNLTLPSKLEVIGEECFSFCSSLSEIILPQTLREIGQGAFMYNNKLKSITIPESVTTLNDNTFFECTGLTEVHLPDNLTVIGSSCFAGCRSLSKIDLSNTRINQISDSTFNRCITLNTVLLPFTLKTIENNAFFNCKSLTFISLPNSVSYVGDEAFSYTSLESFSLNNSNATYGKRIVNNCPNLKYLKLPSIHERLEDMLSYNTKIVEVEIFNQEVLDEKVFSNLDTLVTVKLPNNLTSIGAYAFYYCSSLTTIVLPDTLKEIGEDAFSNSGITSLVVPDSVEKIGSNAFNNCEKLNELTIPFLTETRDSLNCITYSELYVKKLTITNALFFPSVSMPEVETIQLCDSIQKIDDIAFNDCHNLKSINIPKDLTCIGFSAFVDCDSLTYTEYNNGIYLSIGDNPYEILVEVIDGNQNVFEMHPNTKHLVSNIFDYTHFYELYLSKYISNEELGSISSFSIPFDIIYFYGSEEEWVQNNYSSSYYTRVIFVDPVE